MCAVGAPTASARLLALADSHPCASHRLFDLLDTQSLTVPQAAGLLKNYDAHASVLRRLLLKAATYMPEPAVGFVLENVRNEYGNGVYENNHQAQLQDVAWSLGVEPATYSALPVMPGIKRFIADATKFYSPPCGWLPKGINRGACVAGAITATEVLAIKEFRSLQAAFRRFGLEHHIWFHHVTIEEAHTGDSLALAMYFIERHGQLNSVEYGMRGVLDANCHLYEGLVESLE